MKTALKTLGMVLLPMVVIVFWGVVISLIDHPAIQFCIFIGGAFTVGVAVWASIMHLTVVHNHWQHANEMKKNALERIARDDCYRTR